MEIRIEKIKAKDVPKISSHYTEWIDNLFPEYPENVRKRMIKKIYNKKHLLEEVKRDGIILTAYLGKELVGMFVADPPLGGLSYSLWLMVGSAFQGRGIGKALLKKWEEEAKKQGCHNLRVEADHRNVGFYEKVGFKLIGMEKKGYFGTDNYLFQKIIGEPNVEKF